MATWADTFRPIFDGGAGQKGWTADDADFPPPPDAIDDGHLPAASAVFRALEEIAPDKVRYVILGQDPYASFDPTGVPHAMGIAFAIDKGCEDVPPSLERIRGKIYLDGLGRTDLLDWRRDHRVLLLNASLTVPRPPKGQTARHVAGLHLPFWKRFTASLVTQVRVANPDAKLIAWGVDARNVICDALERSGAFVSAYHPTTYSGGDKSFEAFWETDVGRELGHP